MRLLKEATDANYSRWAEGQKHLAAHPGEDFTSAEVAPIMGLKHGWNSVAGASTARIVNVMGRWAVLGMPRMRAMARCSARTF